MSWIPYIPIFTTLLGGVFFVQILKHYQQRKGRHLLWWTIGVLTFILGTASESYNSLFGFNEFNLRFWYIIGALLGGFPLAQGTVYLLMKPRFAFYTSLIFIIYISVAAILVWLSPVTLPDGFDGRLTGSVLEWSWVRLFSPFINIYAFLFLVGGACVSAYRYYVKGQKNALYF